MKSVVGRSSFVVGQNPNFVIPTGVRPSALGWANGVEEPAVLRRPQVLALTFFAVLFSAAADAQNLPKGWRHPKSDEVSQKWRLKDRNRFVTVRGDFDDKDDLAELLVSKSGHKCALFVRLSSERNNWMEPTWQVDKEGLGQFGINIVRPGKHDTLCSSDTSSCDPKTPSEVDLRTYGIQFFSYGQASSLTYWDERARTFQWVPMSD